MDIPQDQIQAFQDKIFTWYSQHKRDLPWRKTRDPYRILVSEVMLQQTQVNRVIPKYDAWFRSFPTIEIVANAPKSEVLRLWSGLGYNRRALFLQKTALAILQEHGGVWPETIERLKQLPGIGEYTSRALACFAFDQQVAVVDTNVKKVILIEFADYGMATSDKEFQEIATRLLPEKKAYDWNQALMDYASAVLKKEKIPIKKQSQFVGSNRYYRGKVLKYLLSNSRATEKELASMLHDAAEIGEKQVDIGPILKGLEKDGFILQDGKYLKLSE